MTLAALPKLCEDIKEVLDDEGVIAALASFASDQAVRLKRATPAPTLEAVAAPQQQDGTLELRLGCIAKDNLRSAHHGVKSIFPWLDTSTDGRATDDGARQICAKVDEKFALIAAPGVLSFDEAWCEIDLNHP